MAEKPIKVAMLTSNMIGFMTYIDNLRRMFAREPGISPVWLDVAPSAPDIWEKAPQLSLRIGLRAAAMLRALLRRKGETPDCLLVCTVPIFILRAMRRIPTVYTYDCTPRGFDEVALAYYAQPMRGFGGWLKNYLHRIAFKRAHTLVAWNKWTADSFIRDYGIIPSKVKTIYQGIDLNLWTCPARPPHPGAPLRLLFVGGHFERKGGLVLLEVMRSLVAARVEADIVSGDDAAVPGPGIRVHRGLRSNDPRLLELFAKADVFVLPTFGECSPWVILEAMASGLPVISTGVAAIPEMVLDGDTGLLIPPRDPAALQKAIETLRDDPDLRLRMGRAGRALAERQFNAEINTKQLIAVIKTAAHSRRG